MAEELHNQVANIEISKNSTITTFKCDWCKKDFSISSDKDIVKVMCDVRHIYCNTCFINAKLEVLDTCPGTKKRECHRKLPEHQQILRALNTHTTKPTPPPPTIQSKPQPTSTNEIPFVGPIKPFTELINEYANETIRNKISTLSRDNGFINFRGIRGDGNCYYRAMAHLLLEDIKEQQIVLETEITQYGKYISQQERNKIVEALRSFKTSGTVDLTDADLSQALVRFLRKLTSHALRHHEVYRFYFETPRAFEEKCEMTEKMGEEAEHMEINALLTHLGLTCQLIQLDRNAGDVQVYTLPDETSTPRYFLLYRPGHYDILYKSSYVPL